MPGQEAIREIEVTTGSDRRSFARRTARAVRSGLVGAGPGIALVLIAEYVIDGEMQLTVGAPGILLAVAGGVVGLAHGLWPDRR